MRRIDQLNKKIYLRSSKTIHSLFQYYNNQPIKFPCNLIKIIKNKKIKNKKINFKRINLNIINEDIVYNKSGLIEEVNGESKCIFCGVVYEDLYEHYKDELSL